ncbi:MAG: C40 family peptidase [Clostridia bacterium]|nr:NlpC/P60 family protein [Oscillospiraceae bacterium]MBR6748413.1 C40 family peptidase [Clostridia bacterium]
MKLQTSRIRKGLRTFTLGILGCACFAFGALAVDGTVDTQVLNVRSETSTDSKIVGKVRSDDVLDITGRFGGWYAINYKGDTAFVFADYVDLGEKNLTMQISFGIVDASCLKVREQPTTSSKCLTRLLNGTMVSILGYSDGWYYIKYTDTVGYVSADYLKVNAPITYYAENDPTALDPEITDDLPEETKEVSGKASEIVASATVSSSSQERQDIINYAMKFLGTPYKYGGNTPKGFDCSGFTQYVFKHFGYSLNRSSSAQINNGEKIMTEDLLPGDLVFFSRSGYAVGHVGIYVGDNQFIHSTSPGDVVKVSSMDESYYVSRYVGARRILD